MKIIFKTLFISLLFTSLCHAKSVPEMDSNSNPVVSDLTYTIDVSDTSENSRGTSKKARIDQLFKAANMTIDGVNIGIASTNPSNRLEVLGTVKATAFIGDGSGLSGVSGAVSDAAYSASWDGDTATGASKNVLYDKIETIVSDSVYGSGWNGDTAAPSKNAVYDKIETLGSGGGGSGNVGIGTANYITQYVGIGTLGPSSIINLAGNIGMGTNSPRTQLDVSGGGYFASTLTVGGSSSLQFTSNSETISNTINGYNDFSGGILTSGNVGVSTTTPSSALHVVGNARITGLASCDTIDTDSSGNLSCGTDDGGSGGSGSGNVGIGTTGWMPYYGANGSTVNATNNIQIIGANVGIGTSTAAVKLAVTGAITATGAINGSNLSGTNTGDQTTVTGNAGTVTFADAGGDTTTFVALGTAATGSLAPATDSGLSYNATTDTLTATNFVGDGSGLTGIAGASGWTDGGSNVYQSTTTDKVGIGTTTPSTTLEIVKQSSLKPLMVSATATGDGDYLIIDSSGNVGIGTVVPTVKLAVRGSSVTNFSVTTTASSGSGAGAGIQAFQDDGAAVVSGDRLAFYTFGGSADTGDTLNSGAAVTGYASGTYSASSAPTELRLETAPSGSTTRVARVYIKSDGNVGIGTALPRGPLDLGPTGTIHLQNISGTSGGIQSFAGNVGIGTVTASSMMVVGTTGQFKVDSSGVLTPGGYKAVDGTTGVTVTTCTGYKNGLCISGT